MTIFTDFCKSCSEFDLVKLQTFKGEQYCSWECFCDDNVCIEEIENIMRLICRDKDINFMKMRDALTSTMEYQTVVELSFDIYETIKEPLDFCLYDLIEFLENVN